MSRISSLFIASTLVILPISAFAQQTATPLKTGAPSGVMSATPTSDNAAIDKTATDKTGSDKAGTDKTAATVAPATATAKVNPMVKPSVKATTQGVKTEVHGMKTVNAHHARAHVPAKTAEPTKSQS
jgi:hypothetical protein